MEPKKIVIIDTQHDFSKIDGSPNMVTRQNAIDSGLPMFKLSDFGEKQPKNPEIEKMLKKAFGKLLPAKSHTVRNRVIDINAGEDY